MAPTYKQMNTAQRQSRKDLIGQVSNLLVKRKNSGTGAKIPKPVAFGGKKVAMRPAQTPNYLGAYHKKRNRANHAFRVPTIGGDFGA